MRGIFALILLVTALAFAGCCCDPCAMPCDPCDPCADPCAPPAAEAAAAPDTTCGGG